MDSNKVLNILIKTDPFELLEKEVLKELSRKTIIKTYKQNTYVFKQGDPSLDCLFIIVSGLVEITVANDKGAETVIGLRRSYDFFGEAVVLSQQRYPGSARVKKELVCCLIYRKELENLIYNYPHFSGFFNALLAERMRLLYGEIINEKSYEAPNGFESPLLTKRVSEVMSSPVITCRTNDQVVLASKIMADKDISSIVALDNENKPRGILTEKNLVRHLIANQIYPVHDCKVENVMHSKLLQIGPESFLGQALVSMIRSNTKYLIVMERGKLVGIITMVDIAKTRSTGSLLLPHDIESQQNYKGLSVMSREIDKILSALIAEKSAVHDIFEIMSELHERLTRRVIQLSEERMKLEGWGAPPVDYCWINMGSAARYEQALRTDQDNAMIYEDPQPDKKEEVENYFSKLAEFIVEGLSDCGFARCKENVMATNPRWRRSLSEWITAVHDCIKSCDPEDTRTLTTFLDFRPIWGNMSLAEKFWETISEAFRIFLSTNHMGLKGDPQYKLPISFLGTFITEKSGPHKNEIDLKKTATVHIVNGIRLFAIKNLINEPSTFGRLKQLEEIGAISMEDSKFFATTFEAMMMFRIRENMKKIKQGKEPDNYIDPYSLRKRERMILKDSLSGVSRLQDLVNSEFNIYWLRHFAQ